MIKINKVGSSKVSKNILDIELGKGEDLWDLIVLQMLLLEDLPSVFVNYVSELVKHSSMR